MALHRPASFLLLGVNSFERSGNRGVPIDFELLDSKLVFSAELQLDLLKFGWVVRPVVMYEILVEPHADAVVTRKIEPIEAVWYPERPD